MNQLPEEVIEYRRHIARWVDERLLPQAQRIDEESDFGRELLRELGALGYFGTMYPEEVGGSAATHPYTSYTVLCEELARGSMGFAASVCMQGSTATHTLHAWGSDVVKREVPQAGTARREDRRVRHHRAERRLRRGAAIRTRARRSTAAGASTAARSSPPTAPSPTSSPWSRPRPVTGHARAQAVPRRHQAAPASASAGGSRSSSMRARTPRSCTSKTYSCRTNACLGGG